MLKKSLYFFVWSFTLPAQAIVIGHNMLSNSPSGYLLDLDVFCCESSVTWQIGNELYKRDYEDQIDPYVWEFGRFDERPAPPPDSPYPQGQWVWIPESLNSPDGTWYWVESETPYYITLLKCLTQS